jgi:hypothetical protein
MRALLFFIVVAAEIALSSLPAAAARSPWCFGLFPVDIIDCESDQLFNLHNEVEDLYAKAISAARGREQQGLIAQRRTWLVTRGSQCRVPPLELVTDFALRQARPCLVRQYEAHIAELNKLLTAQLPKPDPVSPPGTSSTPPHPVTVNTTTCNPRGADYASVRCFWEHQVFQCKVGNDVYPAKNDNIYDPKRRYDPNIPKNVWEVDYISDKNCDDGDMAFFNGLLCAAGESRGCAGVALAQDTRTGEWWRSKRLIGTQPSDGTATFSTEAGLGVLLYMVKTGDKDKFDPWLDYIRGLPHTYSPLPSYCPHKECVFKIIDCPLLVTVASRFNETTKALSVCDPLQFLHLPTPDQILMQLQDGVNQLLDAASRFEALQAHVSDQVAKVLGLPQIGDLLPKPAAELRTQSDQLFAVFRNAMERLLGPQIGEAAAQLAQQIALVNSVINSLDVDTNGFKINVHGKIVYEGGGFGVEGASVTASGGPLKVNYNPNGEHIAAVEVFLLRNLGYSSDVLTQAASYAVLRDRYNPFFQYLLNGRAALRQSMLDKCPTFERPSVKRFQWFLERGEEPQPNGQPAWIESMYWDCIFLGHISDAPVSSALMRTPSTFDPFGNVADALQKAQQLVGDMKDSMNKVIAWIKKMEDTLRPDIAFCKANPNNDLCKLIPPSLSFCDQNPNNEACKGLPQPGETPEDFCKRNPNNEACKIASQIPVPVPGGSPGGLPIPLPGGSPIPIPGGGGLKIPSPF